MTVETASFINDLNISFPGDTDFASEGAAHMRLIKSVLKDTFPLATAAFSSPKTNTTNVARTFVANDNQTLWLTDTTSGAVAHILPVGSTVSPGYKVGFMKTTMDNNAVTVTPSGTDRILSLGPAAGVTYVWGRVNLVYAGNGVWYPELPPFAGEVIDMLDGSPRAGFIPCVGTIGPAGSGGTTRAASDCQSLYHVLWNSLADTEAPVVGGRGATALADWTASKALTLPDARGRTTVAKSNLGGSTSTVIGVVLDGTVLGKLGGTEQHLLVTAQMPKHDHVLHDPGHVHSQNGGGNVPIQGGPQGFCAQGGVTNTGLAFTNISMDMTGGDQPHPNLQPSLITTKQIRL